MQYSHIVDAVGLTHAGIMNKRTIVFYLCSTICEKVAEMR